MTFSQAKIDAFAALDAAIDKIREVYAIEHPENNGGDILKGWVLLTGSVKYVDPCEDSACDDLNLLSRCGMYEKRGQDPIYTYGIMRDAIRHYEEIQIVGDK